MQDAKMVNVTAQTPAQKEAAYNRSVAEYKLSVTGRNVSNEEARAAVSFAGGKGVPSMPNANQQNQATLIWGLNQHYTGGGGYGSAGSSSYQQQQVSGARQRLSNLQQQQGRTLAQQNVKEEADARSRDTNYIIKTHLDLPNAPSTSYAKGTRSDIGNTPFSNPFSTIEKPKTSGYQFSDVWTALNPWSKPSGTLTLGETKNILSGGYIGSVPIPGIVQLKGFQLAKAQRESSNLLQYNKAKDIQALTIANVMATDKQGLITGESIQPNLEKGWYKPWTWNQPKENKFITYPYANFEKVQGSSALLSRGISFSFDKNIKEETFQVSPTETQTLTTTSYSNIIPKSMALNTMDVSIAAKELKAGMPTWKVATQVGLGTTSEYLGKGLALSLGFEALGGFAVAENLVVGGAGSLIANFPKLASATNFAMNVAPKVAVAGLVGFGGYETVKESYLTSKEYKEYGLTSTQGAIIGGVSGLSKQVGFWTGASKGELSPLQIQPVVTNTATGKSTTYALGIVNPVGRSGFSLGGYTKGEGLFMGAFKPATSKSFMAGLELESGNQLGLQVLKQSLGKSINAEQAKELFSISQSVLPKTNKLQASGISTIDLTGTKWYGNLNAGAKQEMGNILKELGAGSSRLSLKGLATAWKENVAYGMFSKAEAGGLERGFGSLIIKAESGASFPRLAGDIDFNVFGQVTPKIESYAARLNKFMPGEFIAKEGKLSFQGEKIFEGFGQDTLQLQRNPLGFRGQFPKAMTLETGGGFAGQKFGESLTQKFSTALTIQGTPKGLFIGPRVGQEKAIPDIYKMLGRASELSGKNAGFLKIQQEQFGKLAMKINPNIDLISGTIITPSMVKSSPLLKSIYMGGYGLNYQVPGTSSIYTSASTMNLGLSSFSKSISSLSKRSSFSMPSSSSLSKSLSSSSSRSSRSSRSSLSSSLSSLSSSSSLRSSISSLSSLSSLSSSSSSSSSKSSSSSSSSSFSQFSLPPPPPPLPSLGGYIIPKGKKKGKESGYSILPSFSSVALGLTMKSPLKVSKEWGVAPFQQRRLLVGKKSYGNYFKLVGANSKSLGFNLNSKKKRKLTYL